MNNVASVNLRLTHPFLWSLYLAFAVGFVYEAFNFWLTTPTFNPIPKHIVGIILCVIGTWQLVWLLPKPNLGMVRLGGLVTAIFLAAWGWVNADQAREGKASFQLSGWMLLLLIICALMLREKPVNPLTRKKA